MYKTLAIGIGVIVIAGLAIWYMGSDRDMTPAPGVSGNVQVDVSGTPPIKTFTVTAANFTFSPATMTVNRGDRVRITLKNGQGTHDLKIDELGVNSGILQSGQEKVVEFVADKPGGFEYYCSVGSHRQMGMKGTLTVR